LNVRLRSLLIAAALAGCGSVPPVEEPPPPAVAEPNPDQLRTDAARWAIAVSDKIRARWIKPSKAKAKFDCTVEIELTPAGRVTSVELRKSCGSKALDESILHAVRDSEPLPLPANPAVFEPDLVLHFIP
jgi:colicin import membrane protein